MSVGAPTNPTRSSRHSGNGHRGSGCSVPFQRTTDLPEGEVVELVPIDEVLAHGGDGLDDEERERLHHSIERGLADVKAGRTVEAGKVIEKLRARAERHAVIAERAARVQSGDPTTLSMDDVERSIRDELDL